MGRRPVRLRQLEDGPWHVWQLVNADDSPVGVGLFRDRIWATEYARGRGWSVVDEPVRIALTPEGTDR
jgi:hypothetical protein